MSLPCLWVRHHEYLFLTQQGPLVPAIVGHLDLICREVCHIAYICEDGRGQFAGGQFAFPFYRVAPRGQTLVVGLEGKLC